MKYLSTINLIATLAISVTAIILDNIVLGILAGSWIVSDAVVWSTILGGIKE